MWYMVGESITMLCRLDDLSDQANARFVSFPYPWSPSLVFFSVAFVSFVVRSPRLAYLYRFAVGRRQDQSAIAADTNLRS